MHPILAAISEAQIKVLKAYIDQRISEESKNIETSMRTSIDIARSDLNGSIMAEYSKIRTEIVEKIQIPHNL